MNPKATILRFFRFIFDTKAYICQKMLFLSICRTMAYANTTCSFDSVNLFFGTPSVENKRKDLKYHIHIYYKYQVIASAGMR